MRLTRRMEFSAAHRVGSADCAPVHGHNYVLEVTLAGEPDTESGMVLDLKQLKRVMDEQIGERFDHRNLNEDTPYFADRLPTGENFATLIYELLDAALPSGLLQRVRLHPHEDHWIEVSR